MPSAQVLQAFFERIALQSLRMPPTSRAFCQVYQRRPANRRRISAFFMVRTSALQRTRIAWEWLTCPLEYSAMFAARYP